MLVFPVNHRARGWRESSKLVPPIKAAIANFGNIDSRLQMTELTYYEEHPGLLFNVTAGLNYIQSARILIDYFKESR